MNDKLQVLIVDDEEQMLSAMEAVLGRLGHIIFKASNGIEALAILDRSKVDLVISDMKMPEMGGLELLAEVHSKYPTLPMVMITAYGTINHAVEAMKNGAFDFITKPFSAEDLEGVITRLRSLGKRLPEKEVAPRDRSSGAAIITGDVGFKKIIETAISVAPSSASVLIQGESGTGKELIAKLIHTSSGRSGPFVAVNCAALPENLLESELFGHEKGSFTGALATKIGKFELANGGTILLDEISEMEATLQAKLLRVLQEREVDRVGGQKPVQVDVRVIATTNRNIPEMIRKGEFREDLFYRLNVIPLAVPPLRERQGDVRLLLEHFVRRFSNGKANVISPKLLSELDKYNWPGNVRELQNACERAVLLSTGEALELEKFMLGSVRVPIGADNDELRLQGGLSVAEMERRLIMETLRLTGNNRTRAAEMLGISIRTLRNKLHEYGVSSAEADT